MSVAVEDIAPAPVPTRRDLTGEGPEDTPYYLTTPDGERKRHRRASTVAAEIEKLYALERYKLHQAAAGIGRRKDLYILAGTHDPETDKDVFDVIIRDAEAAAASNAKANLGTAVHKMVEDLHRGAALAAFDPDYRPYLRAYRDTMAALPLHFDPAHLEQIIIYDDYLIAGKFDAAPTITAPVTVKLNTGRTVELQPGDRVIDDLKSGRWLSKLKWSAQLAIYANNQATWTKDDNHPHGGVRGERLEVRRDVGLIVHLPLNERPARCIPYWIDLNEGYDAFILAVELAGHRAQEDNLLTPWTDYLPTAIDIQMTSWVEARLAVLKTHPAAAAHANEDWPFRDEHGATIRYSDLNPTTEQLCTLLAFLDHIEAEHKIPFTPQPGPNGSTTKPTNKKRATR